MQNCRATGALGQGVMIVIFLKDAGCTKNKGLKVHEGSLGK